VTLTDKQQAFCEIKLKTILSRSTGVRGLSYDNFTGYFTVRDLNGEVVESFTDITEAIESLLCNVHRFRSVDPDTVFAVIEYLGLSKFAR
jgi:hypothetical protein